MEFSEQELNLRAWMGSLSCDAEVELAKGHLPNWLQALDSDGHIDDVMRRANLPSSSKRGLLIVMLTLDLALRHPQPPSSAALKNQWKDFLHSTNTYLKKIKSIDHFLLIAMSEYEEQFEPDSELPTEVSWHIGAFTELRCAVERFIDQAAKANIEPSRAGAKTAVTTLAMGSLVSHALEGNPLLTAAELGRLAEWLLDPVVEEQFGQDALSPNWADIAGKVINTMKML